MEASWTRNWTLPLHRQMDSRLLDQHGSLEFHQCLRRGKSIDDLESPEKEEPHCQSLRNVGTSGFRGNWFSITFNNWVVSSNIVWNWVGTEGEGSFQFSLSVISNSLRLHGLEHTRLPCPLPTPGWVWYLDLKKKKEAPGIAFFLSLSSHHSPLSFVCSSKFVGT